MRSTRPATDERRPVSDDWPALAPSSSLHAARLEDPRVQLVIPALVVAVVFLINATAFGRFALQATVGMMVHEFGHATAAWMSGVLAVPVPLMTLTGSGRSTPGLAFGLCVIAVMVWKGVRHRMWLWLGIAVLAAAAMIRYAGFASEQQRQLWISFSGIGGEFVLSALCVIASFHRMTHRPRWAQQRYVVLIIGLAVFVPSYLMWSRIGAGTEPFPFGSVVYGPDDGDMNRLVASGLTQETITNRYFALRTWCLAAISLRWFVQAVVVVRAYLRSPSH